MRSATSSPSRRAAATARVMLAAHMDEIGFMARYVDERGFVRIQPLGGFDPRVLVAQRVIVHTASGEQLRGVLTPASKPIHLLADEKPGVPKLEEFYIDSGPARRAGAREGHARRLRSRWTAHWSRWATASSARRWTTARASSR